MSSKNVTYRKHLSGVIDLIKNLSDSEKYFESLEEKVDLIGSISDDPSKVADLIHTAELVRDHLVRWPYLKETMPEDQRGSLVSKVAEYAGGLLDHTGSSSKTELQAIDQEIRALNGNFEDNIFGGGAGSFSTRSGSKIEKKEAPALTQDYLTGSSEGKSRLSVRTEKPSKPKLNSSLARQRSTSSERSVPRISGASMFG